MFDWEREDYAIYERSERVKDIVETAIQYGFSPATIPSQFTVRIAYPDEVVEFVVRDEADILFHSYEPGQSKRELRYEEIGPTEIDDMLDVLIADKGVN